MIKWHWHDGSLYGRGRMIYTNSDYFILNFHNGKIDGEGVLYGHNGARYEGQ